MSDARSLALPAPGSLRAWLLASRPATLTAAAAPVLVGTACAVAVSRFAVGPALAALVGAMLIQIGTNFANDLFDFEKGTDDADRLGPTRAAQAGLLTPPALRAGMVLTFGLAMAVGIYLTWIAGWPIVIIGLASIAAGIAYTGGPFPLGYHGLGDLFVMVFFGFVAVCGTAYVQVGSVPAIAWWASVPVGSLATAILVVNNLRDRVGDARAGKRTLAVRLGPAGARAQYLLLLAVAYAVPPALLLAGLAELTVLIPMASLPVAFAISRNVLSTDGAGLNPCLGATARLLAIFGALFALGLGL